MPLFSKKIVPTDITASIEKATNPSVTELDWALVFQICDSVNSTELGAKEARKLLQKKMMSNEPKTQVLALEILNSLTENCAAKFQSQLAAKSFGEDLHKLASSKISDDRVHGKLAKCLETWQRQFGSDPSYIGIRRAYDVMMNGITGGATQRRPVDRFRQQSSSMPRQQQQPAKPVDVKGDIELALNSAQLFSQTLSFTDPTVEDISKNELIQEFYNNCKQAQQILASHLETCEDSSDISHLINANNELLSCFKSYDEMLEQHAVSKATENSQSLHNRSTRIDEQQKQQQQQQHQQQQEESILTSSSSSAPLPAAAPQHNYQPSDDPFDPFADTNKVQTDTSVNTAGNTLLPPPLTPQRMHNE